MTTEPEVWDEDEAHMVRPVDPHRYCHLQGRHDCQKQPELSPAERAERIKTLRALVSRRRTPSAGRAG
ncbi:hypothetical protein [Streptomyces sp. cg35]|uniref:hypothetical protein n=1 Tax=Streptomyces sp. cg35 TaxID=3421650 RepID=UPI003D16A0D0